MQNRLEMRCKGCGRLLSGEGEPAEEAYCSQCLIERAEKYIGEAPVEKRTFRPFRETMPWKIAMVLILLIGLGFLAYQVPRLMTAFKEPKPIRTGSDQTDELTDQCIQKLWQISHLMQQGRSSDVSGLLCPASKKPYVLVAGAEWEARCPNPAVHGFRDLLVRKTNPVPELKK